jgi:hypothetical protein
VIPNIHKEAFEHLLECCKISACNFPEITKIKSNNASEYIGNDLSGFMSKLSHPELNNLYKAAHFLKIKGLQQCLAAYFACLVYIPLNLESYNKKMEDLGIKKPLTTEVSKEYKNKYMFL